MTMDPDQETTELNAEDLALLEGLVRRARALGISTGVRDEELKDLDRDAAADLIEQLQLRLGETAG
jgi:hypothetical protein